MNSVYMITITSTRYTGKQPHLTWPWMVIMAKMYIISDESMHTYSVYNWMFYTISRARPARGGHPLSGCAQCNTRSILITAKEHLDDRSLNVRQNALSARNPIGGYRRISRPMERRYDRSGCIRKAVAMLSVHFIAKEAEREGPRYGAALRCALPVHPPPRPQRTQANGSGFLSS